jgi:Putative beta barrel porin-7 (BBP7)
MMRKGVFLATILLLGGGMALGQEPGPLPGSEDPLTSRLWGSSEYLLWFINSTHTPPLVIAGVALPATPSTIIQAVPGAPGFFFQTTSSIPSSLTLGPATQTLIGNTIDNGGRSGGQFVLGGWLDLERTVGVEARYFFLASQSVTRSSSSDGNPALAIPFVDANTGQETSYPIAQSNVVNSVLNLGPPALLHISDTTTTDVFSGKVAVTSSSRLQGAEILAVLNPFTVPGMRLELLAGCRYLQLDERLDVASTVTHVGSSTTLIDSSFGVGSPPPITDSFTALTVRVDQFTTHNYFSGGQVGARGDYRVGRVSLQMEGKLALGVMHEVVDINGSSGFSVTSSVTPTTIAFAGPIPVAVPSGPAVLSTTSSRSVGGLFAQPSNIGNYSRDTFAVIPEGSFKIGYQLTERLRATTGYTFLYLNEVVRAGDQIDRSVNPAFLTSPGSVAFPARPLFLFKSSDFWAQGVEFGLEFRF